MMEFDKYSLSSQYTDNTTHQSNYNLIDRTQDIMFMSYSRLRYRDEYVDGSNQE